jgi:hypothetical protein
LDLLIILVAKDCEKGSQVGMWLQGAMETKESFVIGDYFISPAKQA